MDFSRFCSFTVIFILLTGSVLWPDAVYAQEKAEKAVIEDSDPVVTRHQVKIGDRQFSYKTTTGYLILREEDGSARAKIFYTAYTAENTSDPASRPVTFSFNGGPGSSSVWLHLGVLGPRRVLMSDEGNTLPPPYKLVDNDYSWLDLTDLVFIDPVSTGFSRAAEEKEADVFHGVRGDIESVGDFIRRYVSEEQRWASPKFVIGESYGTTRAAGLTDHLMNRYGLYLNGVILVSAITNFQTARFDAGNDLPYVLFLPTYAASGWFHKQLKPAYLERDLSEFLDEVELFARTDYMTALAQGDELSAAERDAIAKKLAEYTGLTEQWITRADLRIHISRFTKELLRDKGTIIGRFDSRYTGSDARLNAEFGERDPSYQPTIQGCFSGLINDYLTRELGFQTDLPYEVLTGRVHPWSYDGARNRYLNTSDELRRAMERNPDMKVWIANGYFDLATPYFATEYTISHMGLTAETRKNISMTYYPAGHMMYLQKSSLIQMKEEARSFYKQAVSKN